ncbi:MAG: TetR/AcrR family transcriptional regulator [Filimonas sp.]|nr:TetR/AcrR family transcriptional regulator [Filimonas sp.]
MSADKREHIINTAIELFAVKGFEGTSIRDLAATAGVNLAMINYYFGSKEKLFESIIDHKAAYSRDALASIANDASMTQMQKMDRVIENYVEKIFSNRHFHRVIYQEIMLSNRTQLKDHIINVIMKPNMLAIKGIFQAGIDSGEFKDDIDVGLTAISLMGTINQIALSKTYCIKILEKGDNYVPYEDEEFKERVTTHLKKLLRSHLLK